MGDGSALAFFQFADQADQDQFGPAMPFSPFQHIALRVTSELQAELHQRLKDAGWKPDETYVLEHGYCRSLYTADPNGLLLEFTADTPGIEDSNEERRQRAHEDLRGWLAGNHESNNTYR